MACFGVFGHCRRGIFREVCARAAVDGTAFGACLAPVPYRHHSMNQRPTFDEGVRHCLARDGRYPKEAYALVRDALDHAQKRLAAGDKRRASGHLDGPEILEGFRDLVLAQFGPLARVVLDTWSLRSTLDVGHVVFNLIEAEVFSKSDEDKLSDFEDVFDFEEAFDAPFRPASGMRAVGVRAGAR
jgi:uncharacterized repeat protein (TIGR04138 family)